MTSIQYLFNELWETPKDKLTWHSILNKAKEMHKQEIIDAWNGGDYAHFYSKETGRDFADGSEYYQETFVSKGNDDKNYTENNTDNYPELDGINNLIPQQETLYTEEQVREAYFKGATDVHDKCTDRTWRGVETKVDIELLKKLNAEYIQSLKNKKD